MVESCGMCCGYGPVVDGFEYDLDPFYKKAIDVRGFPTVSAKDVSDVALFQACSMLDLMVMKRPDLLDLFVKGGNRLAIMGDTFLSDLPEWWLVRLIPKEWFGFRPWDDYAGNGAFNGWFLKLVGKKIYFALKYQDMAACVFTNLL